MDVEFSAADVDRSSARRRDPAAHVGRRFEAVHQHRCDRRNGEAADDLHEKQDYWRQWLPDIASII